MWSAFAIIITVYVALAVFIRFAVAIVRILSGELPKDGEL